MIYPNTSLLQETSDLSAFDGRDVSEAASRPVVVIGGGPAGLTAALSTGSERETCNISVSLSPTRLQ